MSDLPSEPAMVELDWSTVDGMFIKQMFVPQRGTMISMHSHKLGHSTLLAAGKLLVWREGVPEKQYSAPAIIYIPPHTKHQYQTLEDETLIYCLHNLHPELASGELSPEDLIDV